MPSDAKGRELFEQRLAPRFGRRRRRCSIRLGLSYRADLLLSDLRQVFDLRHARGANHRFGGRRDEGVIFLVQRMRRLNGFRERCRWRNRLKLDIVGITGLRTLGNV